MQIDAEIMAIADKIKEAVDCEKIYLFGSYAYGLPHKDSDYDFYVVIPDDSIRPLEAMQTIYKEVYKTKMRIPIDVLANYASRFREMSVLPTMERQIVREGIVLYERNGLNGEMVPKSPQ